MEDDDLPPDWLRLVAQDEKQILPHQEVTEAINLGANLEFWFGFGYYLIACYCLFLEILLCFCFVYVLLFMFCFLQTWVTKPIWVVEGIQSFKHV